MTDISKCDGFVGNIQCINRDNCLRYTIKSDDLLQSWVSARLKKNGNCEYYIPNYANEKTITDKPDNL